MIENILLKKIITILNTKVRIFVGKDPEDHNLAKVCRSNKSRSLTISVVELEPVRAGNFWSEPEPVKKILRAGQKWTGSATLD